MEKSMKQGSLVKNEGGLYYPIEEQAVIGSLGANQYDALLTRVLVKQECGPNFISTSN